MSAVTRSRGGASIWIGLAVLAVLIVGLAGFALTPGEDAGPGDVRPLLAEEQPSDG